MILNLIEQFGLKQAKPVSTPIAEVVLSADDHILLSPEEIYIEVSHFGRRTVVDHQVHMSGH